MAEIGFVGLGTMGSAMARRLVDAGHTVRVRNRYPDAATPLVEAGAVRASSAADALASGIVFSMLANDAAVDEVFSEDAVAGASGSLHVNMASISPGAARALAVRHAAAGVGYVAAPVVGRPPVAAAGQLNILAGGSDADIDRLSEYFDVLGARTWRIGTEPAQANVAKIAVNFTIIHAIEALGESIALVENHGIDAADFVELLTSTLFGGVAYSGYGDIIVNRRYEPAGFTARLGLKDLGLAETAAEQVGVSLPTASALRSVFEQTLAQPGAEKLDWAAIAEISRTSASAAAS